MTANDLLPPPGEANATIRAGELARCLGVSLNTISNWVREGRLPEPLALSSRVRVFNLEAVREALSKGLRATKKRGR